MSLSEPLSSAVIHEAGHALVACKLNLPLLEVVIHHLFAIKGQGQEPSGTTGIHWDPDKTKPLDLVTFSVAGVTATSLWNIRESFGGTDKKKVDDLFDDCKVSPENRLVLIDNAKTAARKILVDNRGKLRQLIYALQKKRRMTGAEVVALLGFGVVGS